MDTEKQAVVVKAVDTLNRHKFGLTGIKIELEAQLNRRSDGAIECPDCYSGSISCPSCMEDEYTACQMCDGDGLDEEGSFCESCDGDGEHYCRTCLIQGNPAGGGRLPCPTCEGQFRTFPKGRRDWSNLAECHQYILEKLEPLGLAEEITDETEARNLEGWNRTLKAKHPLVFSRFYRDGSVDSEFTATIATDDPENVLLLPKIIEAFKDLATANGNGCDTTGAGMHIALINGEGGKYPSDTVDRTRFVNFKKSMTMLLPALYFLGTHKDTTRAMGYRRPGISSTEKHTAISYRGGAVEFRIFDTCYDNPEAVLDNVVVMKNAMKYWRKAYLSPGVHRICKQVKFGTDSDYSLGRLYCTEQHIALLNAGLERLKPSYYTIKELKKQRNFNITKQALKGTIKKAQAEAEIEYREYEQRFVWRLLTIENQCIASYRESSLKGGEKSREEVLKEVGPLVKEKVEQAKKEKKPKSWYIEKKLTELTGKPIGQYELKAAEA